VISVATVRFLEQQYGAPLEPARFRSNLLLDLPEARAFEEDRWIGRRAWIGDAQIEIVRPCEQCIVPVLDAETPERSPGVLNAIVARGEAVWECRPARSPATGCASATPSRWSADGSRLILFVRRSAPTKTKERTAVPAAKRRRRLPEQS
jgi:hypothetical protein